MTVSDLIERLAGMPPHAPVKVLLSSVCGVQRRPDGSWDVNDDAEMDLDPNDAIEADIVTWEGNYVLIESR